jgi:hypothetical protein
MTMKELAERVEAATANDAPELLLLSLEAILLAEGHARDNIEANARVDRFCELLEAKAFLDAAMTLVPEGWNWLCRDDIEERGSFANVSRPDARHIIDTWDEDRMSFYASDTNGSNYARATTPALALTAAALRAIASQETTR